MCVSGVFDREQDICKDSKNNTVIAKRVLPANLGKHKIEFDFRGLEDTIKMYVRVKLFSQCIDDNDDK